MGGSGLEVSGVGVCGCGWKTKSNAIHMKKRRKTMDSMRDFDIGDLHGGRYLKLLKIINFLNNLGVLITVILFF